MALAVVNAVSAQGTSQTSITSPTFTSTSGYLLVANGVSDGHSAEAATPFSDNKSNSWSVAVPMVNIMSVVSFVQRYSKNITGGASHTVTYTLNSSGFPTVAVVQISGADTTAPFDKPASTTHTAAANPHVTGTTATTTQADEICVAGITHSGGGNETFASNNGYTVQTSKTSTSNMPTALSTKIISSTGAQAESYNLTANNSVQWAAGVGTYKATANTTSFKDIKSRLNVSSLTLKDIKTRLRVVMRNLKDIKTHLNVSARNLKDIRTRLSIRSLNNKDLKTRIRLVSRNYSDIKSRLVVVNATIFGIVKTRLIASARNYSDAKIKVIVSSRAHVDARTRLMVSQRILKDIKTKFTVTTSGVADAVTRFVISPLGIRDIKSRFLIVSSGTTPSPRVESISALGYVYRAW